MHAEDNVSTSYLTPSEPTRAESSGYDPRTIARGFAYKRFERDSKGPLEERSEGNELRNKGPVIVLRKVPTLLCE